MNTSFFCGNCDRPCELNKHGQCATCKSEAIFGNPYLELLRRRELESIYALPEAPAVTVDFPEYRVVNLVGIAVILSVCGAFWFVAGVIVGRFTR